MTAPGFWDIAWLVLWFVAIPVSVFFGHIFTFILSAVALGEDVPWFLIITVPLGIAAYLFAVFSIIQFIIQLIAVLQLIF